MTTKTTPNESFPRHFDHDSLETMVKIGLSPHEIESVLKVKIEKEFLNNLYRKHFASKEEYERKFFSRMFRAKLGDKKYSKIKNKLRMSIKLQIAEMIARELGNVESLIGYSIEELIFHLESQFTDEFNWETRSSWHIDHIRPRSSFKSTQIKECFRLENLRILPAKENLKKGKKWQEDQK